MSVQSPELKGKGNISLPHLRNILLKLNSQLGGVLCD